MSSKRPSETNGRRKSFISSIFQFSRTPSPSSIDMDLSSGKSFNGNSPSVFQLSRTPSPSSIDMDLSSDNHTSISSAHARATAFTTKAYTSPCLPVTVPVPERLGSASGGGLEVQPTHMSSATRIPVLPSLPDARDEVEQNLSIQDPRSALIANALNADSNIGPMSLATRSPHDAMQVSESEQNLSVQGYQGSRSSLFPNAQNVVISGGRFINVLRANPKEKDKRIPLLQKPNSSPLFVGREDVLDKLREIFIHGADDELMSRRACLLWGKEGIGKTQICLKFIEELCGSLPHVFWVDASTEERITTSLRGIASIPAAQESCPDDSVESVLQWLAGFQEEWLIVFDKADETPVYVVEKFIPPGNRGNILITNRKRSIGRIISFQNVIEIKEMEEADAITLLLRASHLDPSPEYDEVAKSIVTELGCVPFAVDQAGAYIESGKCSIDKFLHQFTLHRETLMSDGTVTGASNTELGTL